MALSVQEIKDSQNQNSKSASKAKPKQINRNEVNERTELATSGVRGQVQNQLAYAKSAVSQIATQREQAVEQVAEAIANLTDPGLFMFDVMTRVESRLGKPSESFENPYDDFTLDFSLGGLEVAGLLSD